jgi:hypothetical protein
MCTTDRIQPFRNNNSHGFSPHLRTFRGIKKPQKLEVSEVLYTFLFEDSKKLRFSSLSLRSKLSLRELGNKFPRPSDKNVRERHLLSL